jgi:hypothetical protein
MLLAVELLGLALMGGALIAGSELVLAVGVVTLVAGPVWLVLATTWTANRLARSTDDRDRLTHMGMFSFLLGLMQRSETPDRGAREGRDESEQKLPRPSR